MCGGFSLNFAKFSEKPPQFVEKALTGFSDKGNVRENILNFAKFRIFSLLFCSAHGP